MSVIRRAKSQDAESIATIHVKMWQRAYRGLVPDDYLDGMSIADRTKSWRKKLENPEPGSHAFVIAENDQVVGWCTCGVSRDDDATKGVGEIYGIYMLPGFTGKGLGSKLMRYSLDSLKQNGYRQATLWVLNTNKKTREWYEAKGWRIEGKTKIDKRPDLDLEEVRYIIDL